MTLERVAETDESEVRNSYLRRFANPLNPLVRIYHKKINPKGTAFQVSLGAAVSSIIGIHLMERQHRADRYSKVITTVAVGLMVVGALGDLCDGKLARLIRSEMADPEEARRDEEFGQFIDPFFDGAVETWQLGESAYTAYKLGHKKVVASILFNMVTSNIPRTLKAFVGMFGGNPPETYLPDDERFFGTSLGRKIPNYTATLTSDMDVREGLNRATGIANCLVAADRIFGPNSDKKLTEKDIAHAKYRAPRLALQSLVNFGVAGVMKAMFAR